MTCFGRNTVLFNRFSTLQFSTEDPHAISGNVEGATIKVKKGTTNKSVLRVLRSTTEYSGVLQSTPRILLEALHCHCGVLPYGIRPS